MCCHNPSMHILSVVMVQLNNVTLEVYSDNVFTHSYASAHSYMCMHMYTHTVCPKTSSVCSQTVCICSPQLVECQNTD